MIDDRDILTSQPAPPPPDMVRELPILPLPQTVLFPGTAITVLMTSPAAIGAVETAQSSGGTVVALTQRTIAGRHEEPGNLYDLGVEAEVARVLALPDGALSVLLIGRWRVVVEAVDLRVDQLVGRVTIATVVPVPPDKFARHRTALLDLLEQVVALSRTLSPRLLATARSTTDPHLLADLVASELPLSVPQRQHLLELLPVDQRLESVTVLLTEERELLRREQARQSARQTRAAGQQADASPASLSLLEHELTVREGTKEDVDHLHALLVAACLPLAVQLRADEELNRLDLLPPGSPDYAVVRTYLQWLATLPWHATPGETIDLRLAAQILDDHHYGLRKVKNRILEQLAVRKLVGGDDAGSILCFVGPPGVGKTSLGRAMAAALGRPFVRVALGGVHDEAEIRGHRRTYVNALPGRIIKAMREANTLNPVFMLDEIDKLGSDMRGDPTAALLEVLDPEQNQAFSDHYLDVPYDLSQVLFVTTANSLDEVEDALVDRLEVIELPGYTEEEKIAIAQRFLIGRQIAVNGLTATPIKIPTATIRQLTRTYTFEAGVRGLERELGALCRKVALRIVEGRSYPRRIDPSLLPSLLGPERFDYGLQLKEDEIGVATGMVWTTHGGDILQVEIGVVEGKGSLLLTGQLGEVMQESAQAALSFTRVNAKRLGIDPRRFEKVDIHVHLPEGGVPKDGPSAGITVVCALVSALTGRKLKRTIAMTGEVTLRGRVLPVGGIREKVLGAYRAGIRHVIVPAKNKPELMEELPRNVQRNLQCTYVTMLDEVLPVAFVENPLDFPWKARKRTPKQVPKTAGLLPS